MKNKLLIILAIIITLITLTCGGIALYIYLKLNEDFPEPSGEFEMQGVLWSPVAYYYHPLIYQQVYNPTNDAKTINNAKNIGANWVLMKAFYNGSENGEVVGDDALQEPALKRSIKTAHENGLKVFLVPYVDSHDYWVLEEWTLDKETWTPIVLKWAKFAQENSVEMFAPGVEMNIILDEDEVGQWFKDILPQIREVYSGKVATSEHYDIEKWKILDEAQAFAGYDCIGMTIFPRKDHDGISDIRSLEEYKEYVEAEAKTMSDLADKYDTDCKIATTLGMDFWQGMDEPPEDARAQAYSIALDVLKEYDFDGVFVHKWSSEAGNWDLYDEVGGMLEERWTK